MGVFMIGVIGLGVVGGGVYRFFSEKEPTLGYDLKNSPNTWEEVLKADVLFLCLPSETDPDGKQDLSALDLVLSSLNQDQWRGVAVVKSTVLPGTMQTFARKFPELRLCHNPEFLTAAKPYEDFCNQESILIGGEDAEIVAAVYRKYFSCPFITHVDTTSTEIAKYMHNILLAVKVGLCNEFYHLCNHAGVEYETVRQMAVSVGVIGATHTRVPGPDGKLGFGNMCFPKDTLALNRFMEENKLKHGILNATCYQNAERNYEYLFGKKGE